MRCVLPSAACLLATASALHAAGLPLKPSDAADATKPNVTVGLYEFHEIVIQVKSKDLLAGNPYMDLQLTATVSPEGGAAANAQTGAIQGFYYGQNQYRTRWLAGQEGRFVYEAKLARAGAADGLTFKGAFTVKGPARGGNRGPAAVSTKNPIWFADAAGKPLYLIGAWSHASLDVNLITGTGGGAWRDTSAANFNKFADGAIANGYLAKDGSPTRKYSDALEAWIDGLAAARINWIVITADHMGWGFQTASNWKGLRAGTFDDPYRYNANSGLIWDHALAYARDKGLYVKMNLQEFCQGRYGQHPFQKIAGVDLTSVDEHPDDMVTNEAARDAWRRWVTYLASRYGPFANVMFQMGNEPPGNGCKLGPAKWGEFDAFTRDAAKSAAGRPVLYSSGAPVGGGVHQGDFNTYHPTGQQFAAGSFYTTPKGKPFHNEEIKAYSGGDPAPFLAGARYVKFASFIGGGHGSALVMWSWKPAMDEYRKSSHALHAFIEPVLADLFDLKPDSSFIQEAPAEFCKGLAGGNHWLVYMQKTDASLKNKPASLPASLVLKLPDGEASVNWFNPIKGAYLPATKATVKDGTLTLKPPADYTDDFALRVSRKPG